MKLAGKVSEKIGQLGVLGTARWAFSGAVRRGRGRYLRWSVRNAPVFQSPTPEELVRIETDLRAEGVHLHDYEPLPSRFDAFRRERFFPPHYHGGEQGGVWDEKMLEHWITSELLDLASFTPADVYLDVAASSSPWVKVLRERLDVQAFAVDLAPGAEFHDLPFYRVENATATTFPTASIRGASLHCAYEMFTGEHDVGLLDELARILRPGGKAVIVPLYLHTHYCAYSTAEYFGKGHSDPKAKEYVRLDCSGVPSSRKYDARILVERILRRIESLGMTYRLLVLRNQKELGSGIYCHFILEITR